MCLVLAFMKGSDLCGCTITIADQTDISISISSRRLSTNMMPIASEIAISLYRGMQLDDGYSRRK
jgi:hypothetical protein